MDDYKHCMRYIRNTTFKTEHLRMLLDIQYDAYSIEGFSKPDFDTMIYYIVTT